MKKILFAIVSIFALAACVKEELPQQQEIVDADQVTLTFDVKVPEVGSATRVMGKESIEYLDVIVFNEAGHHIKTARATLLEGTGVPTAPNNRKRFSVTLDSSSSQRRIHFVANGDASQIAAITGHEDAAISKLFVSGAADAYWQRMVYDGGIGTAADAFGGDDNLVIPLIRNYARVTVDNQATDFTLTGYKVFNTRTDGSVAAYDYDAGAWVDFSKEGLVAKSYSELSGYTPLEVGGLQSSADYVAENGYTYVRETKNVKNDANHPYVIICGTRGGSTALHYYKLDFVYDQGGWANILRNFEYKFVIKGVEKDGCTSEELAQAQSSGENSLSYDMGTESFLNISDGTGQLYVNATTVILVSGEQTFELKYKYIPDVKNAHDVTANGDVNVGGLDNNDVIETATLANSDVNGWRSIIIDPKDAPTGGKFEQPVTLSTTTGLARVVNFILRAPYSLKVNAYDGGNTPIDKDDEEIPATQASKVWVDVTIPADLPEAIFPLEFIFETADNTLSPDAAFNTMPVRTGQSIITGSTSTATTFGFVYTLTEEEYNELDSADGKKTFTAKFKTSTAASATTVWVDNLYFAKDAASASDDFENSKAQRTNNITVTLGSGADYYGAGRNVDLDITLPDAPADTEVSVDVSPGFTITGTRAATIYKTNSDGEIKLSLSTTEWAGTRSVTVSCSAEVETADAIVVYANKEQSVTVNKLYIPAGSLSAANSSNKPSTTKEVTVKVGNTTANEKIKFDYSNNQNSGIALSIPNLADNGSTSVTLTYTSSSKTYTATTTVADAMSDTPNTINFVTAITNLALNNVTVSGLSNNNWSVSVYSDESLSNALKTNDSAKNGSKQLDNIDVSGKGLTEGSTIYFKATRSGYSDRFASATAKDINSGNYPLVFNQEKNW